jgi:hypothetical protein
MSNPQLYTAVVGTGDDSWDETIRSRPMTIPECMEWIQAVIRGLDSVQHLVVRMWEHYSPPITTDEPFAEVADEPFTE